MSFQNQNLVPSWLDASTQAALLKAALEAQKNAYAPYSKFLVGAAILDENGNIHSGCNVENAAYPEGTCAEAGAIAAMASEGSRSIKALLVLGNGNQWVTPCGGCRQKIREFATATAPILIANPEKILAALNLDILLAHSFGPDHLTTI